VTEKDMPLLVCFYIANLDGMEKAIQVLGGIFLSHSGECSTNIGEGKQRKRQLGTRHQKEGVRSQNPELRFQVSVFPAAASLQTGFPLRSNRFQLFCFFF